MISCSMYGGDENKNVKYDYVERGGPTINGLMKGYKTKEERGYKTNRKE